MGSPATEPGRNSDETQHQVTFTHNFAISSVEVSQGDFQALMGWNPSNFSSCGTDCPVEQVSWYDSVAYTNQLTLQQSGTPCYVFSAIVCVDATTPASYMDCENTTHGGINSANVALNGVSSVYDCTGFRLPTEAEWEYAARATTTTATYNGDLDASHLNCREPNTVLDSIAWFCGNAGGMPHVKGKRAANAWGLFDMLGNVWEWCNDWYGAYDAGPDSDPSGPGSGSSRVNRGGSWLDYASYARAALRVNNDPAYAFFHFGLRVARSTP